MQETIKWTWILILVFSLSCQPSPEMKEVPTDTDTGVVLDLDQAAAERMSEMAYTCITQEYPNKLGQVLGDSSYLASPRELHPIFYGCFDWHSAVHGHWSLVRLLKAYPNLSLGQGIREKFHRHFTPENIEIEVAYFQDRHNRNYERTYGWAWLLKLVHELHTWDDPDAKVWRANLRPLEEMIVQKYLDFLPKLNYPIRVGEHPNTAFGMTFAWDYAVAVGRSDLKDLIEQRARDYYLQDVDCPLSWEPGGFDFLSPCLEEADIMHRVLSPEAFSSWFEKFLPSVERMQPATVSDRSDGKLVHLDGLNFSRAWVLYSIASSLPNQASALRQIADAHMAFSLPGLTSHDYAGGHWLASFAIYALDQKNQDLEG
ncbi:MAG: DUF2891 domain-containing protein [Bacteroidota bacterium]